MLRIAGVLAVVALGLSAARTKGMLGEGQLDGLFCMLCLSAGVFNKDANVCWILDPKDPHRCFGVGGALWPLNNHCSVHSSIEGIPLWLH